MTRKKVENTVIVGSWDEADETLRQIGELTMRRRLAESRCQLDINEAKEVLKAAASPLDTEIAKLEAGLALFCAAERQKVDFRTRALMFGAVFFRQRTGLKLLKKWTWKKAAEAASVLPDLRGYLQTSYEIKRDELRNSELSDEQLAAAGVERYTERPFTYELDEEKFERIEPTDQPAIG